MISLIADQYDYYITSQQDPRVTGYPLMDNPQTAIILCFLYLIFIKYIGPAYMKNREALEIQRTIVVYNALQTLFSLCMFIQGLWYGSALIDNIYCNPHVHRTDYLSLKGVQLSWWFLIGRFFEFFDTIFFILRKKNKQVTILHVVHHFTVPLICWVGVKIVPGSQYTFAGLINSFVHTFMYFYYMVASMGPEYKKYLWWKKYMTVLQLTQFIIVIVHTIYTLASGCAIPKFFGYLVLSQAVVFFILFWNFYKQSFLDEKSKKTNEISKPLFDIEKYAQKYKKFFEMCIPNQHVLFSDDDVIQGDQKLEESVDSLDDQIKKTHIE